jgi:peptide/nickel transport system permease protein
MGRPGPADPRRGVVPAGAEFISAAKVLGVPTRRVLFKELLPNLVAPIVISVSLALPTYIVTEAGLTFLASVSPSPPRPGA